MSMTSSQKAGSFHDKKHAYPVNSSVARKSMLSGVYGLWHPSWLGLVELTGQA